MSRQDILSLLSEILVKDVAPLVIAYIESFTNESSWKFDVTKQIVRGLATDGRYLFVSIEESLGGRVAVYTPYTWSRTRDWPLNFDQAKFSVSHILAHDRTEVFVGEFNTRRILVISPLTGKKQRYFYLSHIPAGFAFWGDKIFICTPSSKQIHVCNKQGAPVQSFGPSLGFRTPPEYICVDTDGTVYVAQKGSGVTALTQKGKFLRIIATPGLQYHAIAVRDDKLIVACKLWIVVYDKETGKELWRIGKYKKGETLGESFRDALNFEIVDTQMYVHDKEFLRERLWKEGHEEKGDKGDKEKSVYVSISLED